MNERNDFINNELYPALFNYLDRAFPQMEFKLRGSRWESKIHTDGQRDSKGQATTFVYQNNPFVAIDYARGNRELIKLYMDLNGLLPTKEGNRQATEALCSICGVRYPEGDTDYIAYRERQERLERIVSQMGAALYSDEGAATLSYLRDVRGCSDEFIRWGGFGFVSESMIPELRDLFKDGTTFPSGAGRSHTLTIPYRGIDGRIKGFVFRSINPDERGKYRDVFFSGTSKRYNFFSATGVGKEIVIVEGEIDALRASFAGVENVVAASGGKVYKEALREAKKRGLEEVTLLFDTEATEERQRETNKKIEEAITTIKEEGLKPYICYLPSEGGKVDADTYLQNHTEEELKTIIYEAISGDMWLYYRVKTKFAEEQPEEGYNPDGRQMEDFANNTLALCNSPFISDYDRAKIIGDFAATTNVDLTEAADKRKKIQLQSKQEAETKALLDKARSLANTGSTEEALSLLREKLPDLSQISREAEYSSLLLTPTPEGIKLSFRNKPVGVPTDYYFNTSYGEQERLILPVGLTYICAPTSHGKSRFLENLAIQLATGEEGGDVLYFSFEEDATAVRLQLLNIYADMPLSRNNLRSLNSYYAKGRNYFGRDIDFNLFKQREAEFLSLLSSGKLRVYYKDYDSTELIEAVRYIAKQRKVKAVFVDYIQLLHTRGTRLQRREELGEMCKQLWRLAEEASIPIVLAAQLNREAYSPLDMASQNIAEAADIERSANTIILLWNSDFYPIPQKSSYYKDKNGTLTDEAAELEGRNGFQIGTGGKIYAKITKNRGAAPNMDAVLDFNGNTGKIRPNDPEQEREKLLDSVF